MVIVFILVILIVLGFVVLLNRKFSKLHSMRSEVKLSYMRVHAILVKRATFVEGLFNATSFENKNKGEVEEAFLALRDVIALSENNRFKAATRIKNIDENNGGLGLSAIKMIEDSECEIVEKILAIRKLVLFKDALIHPKFCYYFNKIKDLDSEICNRVESFNESYCRYFECRNKKLKINPSPGRVVGFDLGKLLLRAS